MKYTVEITDKQQTVIDAIEALTESYFDYRFWPKDGLGNGLVAGSAGLKYQHCSCATVELNLAKNVLHIGSWGEEKFVNILAEFDELAPKIIAVAEAIDSSIKIIHVRSEVGGDMIPLRNDVAPHTVPNDEND